VEGDPVTTTDDDDHRPGLRVGVPPHYRREATCSCGWAAVCPGTGMARAKQLHAQHLTEVTV
jgi:hypothetical protein